MKRPKPAPDIIDVAAHAGVSPATVSRVFNHPDLVRADTRDRVQRAVDALGYIRNRAASAIHGARSGVVGLIVPTIDNAIFARLIQAFSSALEEAGHTLLIATHGYDLEVERQRLRKLIEHRVDGLALVGLEHDPRVFDLIATRDAPAVILWSFADDAPLPCIGSDNAKAGAMAARHLLDLGHRRIATVFPPLEGNDRAAQRYAGAFRALEAAGAAPPPEWRLTARYDLGEARSATAAFLGARQPTAIVAGNDVIARGVLAAVAERGMRAPEDISVIGIGDFTGSADISPSLSTIRFDAKRIAEEAAATLLERMADPVGGQPESRSIPLELIVRETTAAPAG